MELKHRINTVNSAKFPLRPSSCRNRSTIVATKKGWVNMVEFTKCGESGVPIEDISLGNIFFPYDGDAFVDELTGMEPVCTDARFIGVDYVQDMWPLVHSNGHRDWPCIGRAIIPQIINKNPDDVNWKLTEEEEQELFLDMATLGAAASPADKFLKVVVVMEGKPSTGKSLRTKLVMNYLGLDEVATIGNTNNDSYQFGNSVLINEEFNRCKHVLILPDVENTSIQKVCLACASPKAALTSFSAVLDFARR